MALSSQQTDRIDIVAMSAASGLSRLEIELALGLRPNQTGQTINQLRQAYVTEIGTGGVSQTAMILLDRWRKMALDLALEAETFANAKAAYYASPRPSAAEETAGMKMATLAHSAEEFEAADKLLPKSGTARIILVQRWDAMMIARIATVQTFDEAVNIFHDCRRDSLPETIAKNMILHLAETWHQIKSVKHFFVDNPSLILQRCLELAPTQGEIIEVLRMSEANDAIRRQAIIKLANLFTM